MKSLHAFIFLIACSGWLALLGCSGEAEPDPQAHKWTDESALGDRLMAGEVIEDDEWRKMLLERVFDFPSSVDAGENITVTHIGPSGFGHVEFRLVPRTPGLATLLSGMHVPDCGLMTLMTHEEQKEQVLGSLPKGSHQIVFDVEIERRAPAGFDEYEDVFIEPEVPDILWSGELVVAMSAN